MLTPAQKRRVATKARAVKGDPDGATPKRPVGSPPLKGRKQFFADFMRSHYEPARREARRRRQKLGRFTVLRG